MVFNINTDYWQTVIFELAKYRNVFWDETPCILVKIDYLPLLQSIRILYSETGSRFRRHS